MVASKLLPPGSFRRRALKKILRTLHLIPNRPFLDYYGTLVDQNREYIALQPTDLVALKYKPLISIVVPAYNTPTRYLQPLVYSIVSQSYPNWELLLVDGSSDEEAQKRISDCVSIDTRIKALKVKNGGISANTNAGIKAIKGEFVAFADHDDTLDVHALYEVVKTINDNPNVGLIYSDEDKLSEDGSRYHSPHFKPDWSPDLFTRVNYVTHLVVMARSLVSKVGLLDVTKDGAQDYDFLLRAIDEDPVIVHVPKVLYHWREALNSTAQDFSSKPNITNAAQKALEEHLARNKVKGTVRTQADRPGFYDVVYEPFKDITLVITPFANNTILRLFTELLLRMTSLKKFSVTVIVPKGVALDHGIAELSGVKVTNVAQDQQYLTKAIAQSSEHVVIFNQFMLPDKKNWLEKMSGYLQYSRIVAVSPVLINHDDVIEDMGLVRNRGLLIPLFQGAMIGHNLTHFGVTEWERNVVALSGACVLLRKSELQAHLASTDTKDEAEVIREFTEAQFDEGRCNAVLPNIAFNKHGLNVFKGYAAPDMLNPNILQVGLNMEIKTPETAALNVLIHLKEKIDDKAAK